MIKFFILTLIIFFTINVFTNTHFSFFNAGLIAMFAMIIAWTLSSNGS